MIKITSINEYNLHSANDTVLSISSVIDGVKAPHREYRGPEAYDRWHLQFYFEEIISARCILSQESTPDFLSLRRADRDVFTYFLLNTASTFSYTELGSSLFEVIDGYNLIDKINKNNSTNYKAAIPSRDIRWIGIEISSLLRHASTELHSNYLIDLYDSVESFVETANKQHGGYLYDRSVGNYAFRKAEEYAKFVNLFDACFINTFFSLEKAHTATRLGKELTYFSLRDFLMYSKSPVYHLYGYRAPVGVEHVDPEFRKNSIEGYFFVGNLNLLHATLSSIEKVLPEFISRNNINIRRAEELLIS